MGLALEPRGERREFGAKFAGLHAIVVKLLFKFVNFFIHERVSSKVRVALAMKILHRSQAYGGNHPRRRLTIFDLGNLLSGFCNPSHEFFLIEPFGIFVKIIHIFGIIWHKPRLNVAVKKLVAQIMIHGTCVIVAANY